MLGGVAHHLVEARAVALLRPVGVHRPAADELVEVGHGAEHAVEPLRAPAAAAVALREQAHVWVARGALDR